MRFNALTFISILCGLFFVSIDCMAQYRDPFSEKSKRSTIKKRNKRGLTSSLKTSPKKLRDPFRNINDPKAKGLVGLGNDPFNSSGNMRSKPSGVDSDSFSYRQRKRAIKDKYNKEYVKKKSMKSREKHYKLKMKYR